ncbi:MAG TPA: LPS export ABC transporter permease LptF [Thiobacillaceae bacterium]|nr:LPS export ABC transporter permease LptF [Thiobacillaceae bacterium]
MLYRRTLLRELALSVAGILVVLIAIALVTLFVRLLGDAARGEVANEAVATYLGFNLLYFLPVLLSMALFIGVLLVFTRLWRDSEMVIWLNNGLSLYQWIRPVLQLALPLVLIITALTLVLIPWSLNKKDQYRQELKNRSETALITPGLFAETQGGRRVYFVEGLNPFTGVIKEVFLQTQDHDKIGIVVAQEGRHQMEEDGARYLILKHGRRYEGTPGQGDFSSMEFERYWIRLEPGAVRDTDRSSKQARLSALLKSSDPVYKGELVWRLGFPVSALILALMAIPLGVVNNRSRRSFGLIGALLIYFIYNNLQSVGQAWVVQERMNTVMGFLVGHAPMLLTLVILFLARTRLRPLLSKRH